MIELIIVIAFFRAISEMRELFSLPMAIFEMITMFWGWGVAGIRRSGLGDLLVRVIVIFIALPFVRFFSCLKCLLTLLRGFPLLSLCLVLRLFLPNVLLISSKDPHYVPGHDQIDLG